MIDWQLDIDGDLKISDFEDHRVEDMDELVQRLAIRLRTFMGEWFLDDTIGVDYFESIFKKNASYEEVSGALKIVINGTEGVTKITSFLLKPNEIQRRTLNVDFTVQSIYGELQINNLGLPG